MKILVTGGAGFIGSHIADALINAGHNVHIIDDLSGGFRANINTKATFHELDIRSAEVEELWKAEQFEVMYHEAAQMDVRRSVANPIYDADINVKGFLNLMESGRKNGLKKVIFASTGGAIYGEPEYVPQDEVHPLQPLSPYGITKLVTERYLFFYEQSYGIQWIALRYANVYGPRQNPHGEAGVVAIFIEKMLVNELAFINGNGEQIRDYVYVKDVVQANIKALNYPKSGIFNVGTGKESTVITLFRNLKQLTLTTIPEDYKPAKAGEQMRSVISTEKITKEMGWVCQYDLKVGLAETVGWFKRRQNVAKQH
ncbi:MAG: NAD-dependent epimerase/dehydratase family protein [Bacteroidetes bacterium]|nr:NAD-dependent epimerase/dehydratase family protein [Bacteroidota bacterium]